METLPLRSGRAATPAATSLANPILTGSWAPLGPQPIADETSINGANQPVSDYGPAAGRVTSLVLDPADGNTIYMGSAGGGVWKSANGGASWATTMDGAANLSIGALAIDAAGTTIYAATGEDNGNADAQWGAGILRSTDSGATWTLLGGGYPFATGTHIGGIAVDRTTSGASERVILASDDGLWISPDSGSHWSQITFPSGMFTPLPGKTPSEDFIQVVQAPAPSNQFWAVATDFCQTEAGNILISSDNTASSWTLSGFSPVSGSASRVAVGIGPGGTAYAAMAGDCSSGNIGTLTGLQKTIDGGSSWGPTGATPPDYFAVAGESQGWYDNVVAVDPTNANNAIFGGIDIVTTTDGGQSFNDVGMAYSGGSIHPDFHALAFLPSSSAFYAGNDGGVWQSSDLGATWNNRNSNLSTIQFYAGTSPDSSHIVGGSQDNGTEGILPGSPVSRPAWQEYLDGDGGATLLDPTPGSTTMYASTADGGIWRGSFAPPASPGPTWPYDTFIEADPCPTGSSNAACNQPTAFIAPLLLDQSSPARLLTSTNEVYQTTNGGNTWTAISRALTNNGTPNPDYIATMVMGSVASTANTVLTGSFYGALYRSTNASGTGATWTSISSGLPAFAAQNHVPGEAWISGIAINDANPLEIWVTIGGVGVGHVWHSTTGGTSWTDVSGSGATGIPNNLVVNGILYDPSAPGTLYIATDLGVLACSTCTGTLTPAWSVVGTGLPNARVDAISETANHNQVVAWTHGRGAWVVPTAPVLDVKPTSLTFTVPAVGVKPASQNVTVSNDGVGTLNWTAAPTTSTPTGKTWLQPASPSAGQDAPGASMPVAISVDPTGVQGGTWQGVMTFTSPDGGTVQVSVTLSTPVFPGQFRPVVPYRALDTRYGIGGYSSPLLGGSAIDVQIAGSGGAGGVPAMNSPTPPSAVIMNVTATNESQPSHIIISPSGSARPSTSNLNFVARQDVPNLVEVALGASGQVSAYLNAGSSDLIFDIAGWVTTQGTVSDGAGLYHPVAPARILDTRMSVPVGQQPYHLEVAGAMAFDGSTPVPSTTSATPPEAVVLNLTITNPTAPGYVTVYPDDVSRPNVSSINVTPGLTRANRVTVKLGADGGVDIFNYGGTVNVIIDVNGWFTNQTAPPASSGQFTGVSPQRLLDTRVGIGGHTGPLGTGQAIPLQISGQAGVPNMSDPVPPTAVVLNVTATDTSMAGHLRVYPNQPAPPNTSDLNWTGQGQTVPNLVVVKLSSDGKIAIYNCCGTTDVIVDIFGWYQ